MATRGRSVELQEKSVASNSTFPARRTFYIYKYCGLPCFELAHVTIFTNIAIQKHLRGDQLLDERVLLLKSHSHTVLVAGPLSLTGHGQGIRRVAPSVKSMLHLP